jgi:hypothetical protein
MARWLAVVAVCVLAGCGSSRAPDQEEAATIAKRYLEAVSAKDWEAVCRTRTQSEQQKFARMGGSCERMFQKVFEGKPVDLFDDAKIGDVRIAGDKAGIDVEPPGQDDPVLTLAAVREHGHWLLQDVPDEETP